MSERIADLKQAEKGAIISIITYVFLALSMLTVGKFSNSDALFAAGLNNFTDVIASVTILIGLRVAQKPADNEHRYGHWKAENVTSLLSSLIMFIVGFEVFISSIESIVHKKTTIPDPIAAVIGILSAIVLYSIYIYNKKLAKKYRSNSLSIVAKDNFSDMLTSIGTSVAVFAATFDLAWVDTLTAMVIGLIIIKTAFDIFKESTFYLSDGFDRNKLETYEEEILKVTSIKEVPVLRGRMLGANEFLDITVRMSPTLTVKESHDIVDNLESNLKETFDIFDIDVHVEPFEPKKN